MIEMVKVPKCIHDTSSAVIDMMSGADVGMWWKGYGDQRVLIFRKGELGRNAWNEVMWLWRTPENTGECSG